MKSETLQLLGTLDEASAMNAAKALQAVNGVSKVAVSTADASISVNFDDEATSTQELRRSLQQAGFALKRPAHAEGMCCGSCGG
ncbi:MAG TPA: heavy-metal-associated domain-containing protein [Noviherbaspirillum sp.]